MEPKLREYVLNLFNSKNAPSTKRAVEFREEIICNIIEHYHTLIEEGKSETDAYNMAISSIGDVDELIKELIDDSIKHNEVPFSNITNDNTPINNTNKNSQTYNTFNQNNYTYKNKTVIEDFENIYKRSQFFKTISIILFIVSLVPAIAFSTGTISEPNQIQRYFEKFGQGSLFLLVAIGVGLLVYSSLTKFLSLKTNILEKQTLFRKAIFRALGIALYITVPFVGITGDFLIPYDLTPLVISLQIVGATVLIVFSKKIEKPTDSEKEQYNNYLMTNVKIKNTTKTYKILVAILWILTSILYACITPALFFNVSVTEIGVSWILFVLAFVIQKLMKTIFDCIEEGKNNEI